MESSPRIDRSDRKKADWPRAFRAIRRLQLDPERTDQVFELNVALDGGRDARWLGLSCEDLPGARSERT